MRHLIALKKIKGDEGDQKGISVAAPTLKLTVDLIGLNSLLFSDYCGGCPNWQHMSS